MWRIAASSVRTFAKKAKEAQLTFQDEQRLQNIVSSPVFGELIGMKKYSVNHDAVFAGKANVISWEDRMVGKMTLAEVREAADEQGLDYVIMHRDPMTVRLMNFDNFMFKFKKTTGKLGVRSKRERGRFFLLDGYAETEAIHAAVNSAFAACRRTSVVGVEVTILNHADLDQVARSTAVADRVEQAVTTLGQGRYQATRQDLSALLRVLVKDLEAEKAKEAAKQKEAQAEEKMNEEEEDLVRGYLADDFKMLSNPNKFLNEKTISGRSEARVIAPELIASMPEGAAKRRLTEEALKAELGSKLMNTVLKGKSS